VGQDIPVQSPKAVSLSVDGSVVAFAYVVNQRTFLESYSLTGTASTIRTTMYTLRIYFGIDQNVSFSSNTTTVAVNILRPGSSSDDLEAFVVLVGDDNNDNNGVGGWENMLSASLGYYPQQQPPAVALSGDGRTIATLRYDSSSSPRGLVVFRQDTNATLLTFEPMGSLPGAYDARSISMNHNGNLVAYADGDAVRVYEATDAAIGV